MKRTVSERTADILQQIRAEFHLEVPFIAGGYSKSPRWSNNDLDPVPVEKQTWSGPDYWAYWCSYLLASPLVATVSAVMSLGFTARETVPIVFCGFLLCSCVTTLTGKIGATYHVPYPVLVRAAFGMIGSYPAIFVRAVIAMMWTALLTVTASSFLRHCIAALWPGFENLPNHLPVSAGIDTAGLISFFLWWILQTFLCLMPIQKLRLLFKAKAFIVPPTFFALFLWAVIVTKGGGELVTGRVHLTTDMGPVFSTLSGVNVILGLFSTMAINMPAFGRFSKNRMSGSHHFLALPIIGTLGALTPIFVTSAHQQLWGDFEWYTPHVVGKFENRLAKFVVGASLMLATVGNQVAAGSLPFSNDITGLAPRYINVFRGTILAAVLCVITTPWKIVHNASGLLAFLNGYSCLTGPLAGILVSDYHLLRRGKLDVRELYKEHGIYWYTYGINFRAFFAFAVGVAPMVPGLLASIWPSLSKGVGGSWQPYTVAWMFGFVVSGAAYWGVCWVFPPRESLVDDAVLPPHVGDGLVTVVREREVEALELEVGGKVPSKLIEVVIAPLVASHLK